MLTPPISDLPRLLQRDERFHGLRQWHGAVPVQQIKIETVGAQSLQAALARERSRASRRVVRVDLADEEDFVAPVRDRLADENLRQPLSVHLGGVDHLQTEIETESERGDFLLTLTGILAHAPRSLAESRDFFAGWEGDDFHVRGLLAGSTPAAVVYCALSNKRSRRDYPFAMFALLPLLAVLALDPLKSNREAIQMLERAANAHGSEKDLRLTLTVRGDSVAEGQSLAVTAPFETYPFSLDVRIDQPSKRMHVQSRSEIAGDFQFTDVLLLQNGKGFGLTPELKTYRELTSEPGFLGRYLPHRVVTQALQNRASLRSHEGGQVSFATPNGQFLTLTLDPTTGLLRRIEQIAPQGIWGDGTRETSYEDYRRAGALMLPSRMRVRTTNAVHGALENVYRLDARNEVKIEPAELELPAGYVKADRSYRPSFAARELAPNVHLLENVTSTTGQWSYNVLVVVFDEFVLVAEAPVSSGTSEQILAKVREIAPGMPVKYLVQSHHHDDHLGGIRPYIAEKTTILAGPSVKPLIEKIAAAPFHLDPDRLHREPAAPTVETVAASRTIRDANHEAVIFNIGPNPHARDLLIVHLPKEKILWQADMINDGEYPPNASTRDFEKKIASLGLDYRSVVGLHGRQR